MSSKRYKKTSGKKNEYAEYEKKRGTLLKIGIVIIAVVVGLMFTIPSFMLS